MPNLHQSQPQNPFCEMKLLFTFFFCIIFFSFLFFFNFIFKLYNIVLVLPNIEMNPPQVYLCFYFLSYTSLTLGKPRGSYPVLLPGKSHGWKSLVGCSPWGHQELDMTERLHFHFSLSYTGERNGNPLQCSCLENPRDEGAWWAAICGVAQSRTQLKQHSSSSRRS